MRGSVQQMNRRLVVFVQPSEERIELCVSKGIVPDAPAEPLLLFSPPQPPPHPLLSARERQRC